MARIAGRNGQFYVGLLTAAASAEPVPFGKKWSLDASTDTFDVTAFGDTTKVYVSGLPDAQGTYEGWYDDATAQLYTAASDGAARRFYLYTKAASVAGPYWFGTATWDFSVEAAVDGAVPISGSWKAATPVF
jgi:hypothetical protein